MFAIAEGYYTEDLIFKCSRLTMPPSETREKSMAAYGNGVNFFGGSLFDTSCIANNDHDLDQFVKERMCACVDGWMW